MKIERGDAPPIIIGTRVTIGQALLGALNGSLMLWNHLHPENTIPGEVAGLIAQPIIAAIQIWYVNRYGVTT